MEVSVTISKIIFHSLQRYTNHPLYLGLIATIATTSYGRCLILRPILATIRPCSHAIAIHANARNDDGWCWWLNNARWRNDASIYAIWWTTTRYLTLILALSSIFSVWSLQPILNAPTIRNDAAKHGRWLRWLLIESLWRWKRRLQ